MKRILLLPLIVALILGCVCPQPASATTDEAPVIIAKNPTPGVEMAQAISTITGVAISPLFGTGAVGAWKYFHARTLAEQNKLPWFAQPWFWTPALIIVGLCALKDVFGMAVPAILKKPFDVLETVQHKVSGLVAAGAFVPLVASVFRSTGTAIPSSLQASGAGHGFVAVINSAWLLNGFSIPAMVLVFLIVFLASNAINILILLSPFPMVDAALKGFRLAVLVTIVATALINPWFGALWSVMIIIVAWFISGWSLRLSHLGLSFIWDFCTNRSSRFTPEATGNWMFLARKINDVPIRTYGKLFRDEQNNFIFKYHRWFVLPERTLTLPAGDYAIGKGLLYSELVRSEGNSRRSILLLPPRYRSHEDELVAIYGLAGVRDAGLRAAFVWLREWIGFRPRRQLVAA